MNYVVDEHEKTTGKTLWDQVPREMQPGSGVTTANEGSTAMVAYYLDDDGPSRM